MLLDEAKLHIIPTPIGNLGDMSYRAVEVLKQVDLILAEDTRQTGKLLKHYAVEGKMQSYHQHNEHKQLANIIEKLKAGVSVALCSDAGMPGISDPGYLLIRECNRENIACEVLPGPSAAITAMVGSGLPCDRFVYEGFLPHKKGKQTALKALLEEERATVFYESPHRLVKSLQMIQELLGPERSVVVARELTKKFEEYVRGSASDVCTHFQERAPKGEMVLIVGGKSHVF